MSDMASEPLTTGLDQAALERQLELRLGRLYARQRLGIEETCETEGWFPLRFMIRTTLKLSGLYRRGQRNAARIQVRHNHIELRGLPPVFEGFTLLQLSDLHVDTNPAAILRLIELLPEIDYDICVLTGDYRGRTHGPISETLDGMAQIRAHLKNQIYAVLGNHDSVRMLPGLEDMDIRLLLNESIRLDRGEASIQLAGIDDAHYFRVDNIKQAASDIHREEISILLSHTPEVFHQASHAGFDLLLAGHTHGGQICLPGGIPFTLDSVLPRHMGSGSWRYKRMAGYTSTGVGTSMVAVRFNCPPVITLHHLHPAAR